jgi:hypothetical protein
VQQTGVGRLTTVVAVVLLSACETHHPAAGRTEQRPLNGTERTAALTATASLRGQFNQGGCSSIYRQIDRSFLPQPAHDWVARCREFFEGLGEWQDFRAESVVGCGSPERIVYVDGTAAFANGARAVEITWVAHGAGLELQAIAVRDKGEWLRDPPTPSRPLYDPPVARPA